MSNYKTFIDQGRLRFTIGVQTFTIDYNPTDDPDMPEWMQMQWMQKMLDTALDNLANSSASRKLKNEITEPNDK